MKKLAWLGLRVDAAANHNQEYCIATADSRVPIFVVPTNEEMMIAKHTIKVLGQNRGNA